MDEHRQLRRQLESARIAYKFAAGSSETSGTWTSATSVVCHVYRNVGGIGAYAAGGASSTSISYPAVSPLSDDGTSWVAGFAGHRSTNVALETPPTGMVNRSNVQDSTDEAAGHDTNGGVLAWPTTAVAAGGTSASYRTYTVELLQKNPEPALLVGEVAASGADGYWYVPFTDDFDNATAAVWLGDTGRNFFRFQLPADLRGSVQGAYLQLTSRNADGAADADIRAYLAASPAAPTSAAEAATQYAALTTTAVRWNMPATSADQLFSSPDISAVINELIANGTKGGDYVVLWACNTKSGSAEKDIKSYDSGMIGRPQLFLTYYAQ